MTRTPRARKAVIPAAGLGTRFLPATKAMPKEMLPVVDRPAIEYVVQEALDSQLPDVLVITGRNKRALEDHFDRHPALESVLERKGDDARLAAIRQSDLVGDMHYVRQGEALGLGHAVGCARRHVGDEPFAVLLGDDIIHHEDDLLQRMIDVQAEKGGSVIALMEVPEESVSSYGVAAVDAVPGADDVVRVTDLVEKPARQDAPSNLAIIGRYVLHPGVFDVLDHTPPGRGGEIQLTDALQSLAHDDSERGGVHAVVFRGRRFDTGDKLGYLQAVVEFAAEHPQLGEDMRAWLKEYANRG
ncbi:UTP--glucose-1-phosphate uridylyltransferase GalU [Micrococcus cohnii]|uniref:UTP--glucose-1-phosphate uridylyltransferase n=1 Tax=Micrococcus cohnii TaxID=993416 RepID=A0A7W7M2K3_9MICC|nr:UTP--glucose-1-phosphate uridylyltransferase GalU [Micrococcus cohnii]MBB4735016.1 UTP--glucose-1-phosphate uridylyltransferase [Micrococcus cohnii]